MAPHFRKVRWSGAAIINFHSASNSRNISWLNRYQPTRCKNTLSLEYALVLYFKLAIDFMLVARISYFKLHKERFLLLARYNLYRDSEEVITTLFFFSSRSWSHKYVYVGGRGGRMFPDCRISLILPSTCTTSCYMESLFRLEKWPKYWSMRDCTVVSVSMCSSSLYHSVIISIVLY